ncbi:hypothetical protein [Aquabacterium sp.]|uniref:hypothetical protein n=1 Tax=Aquabacterium sp. TaxID=1872578 RepID=UPI002BF06029|nr:hypothetical protein [Aquabacterium sp.]HSW04266.1 hypothetical protein [Aquabacterium sp.]
MASPPPRQAISIDSALAANETLGRLSERLRASQACFELIAPLLPMALHAQLRPGPIDDEAWTLLAPNGAVSAKLRQLLPALEARLIGAGLPRRIIRVRILTSL